MCLCLCVSVSCLFIYLCHHALFFYLDSSIHPLARHFLSVAHSALCSLQAISLTLCFSLLYYPHTPAKAQSASQSFWYFSTKRRATLLFCDALGGFCLSIQYFFLYCSSGQIPLPVPFPAGNSIPALASTNSLGFFFYLSLCFIGEREKGEGGFRAHGRLIRPTGARNQYLVEQKESHWKKAERVKKKKRRRFCCFYCWVPYLSLRPKSGWLSPV